MKNGVERTFHPNGQLSTEVTIKNGLPNGVTRNWHPNGVLALEAPVKDGVVEGTARQWNDSGQLLGTYEILNGSGVMKHWHPNGRLSGEITFVNGQFDGRIRTWDETGELIGEEFQIANKKVSKKKYIKACKSNPTLPRYDENDLNPKLKLPSTKYQRSKIAVPDEGRKKHHDFIAELRAKPNQAEARQWLAGNERRFLGEMAPEASREVIEQGYRVGAVKITAVDIQDETTNCMIVELPPKGVKRRKVFEWNNEIAQSSGFDPDADWGQNELFVFFD